VRYRTEMSRTLFHDQSQLQYIQEINLLYVSVFTGWIKPKCLDTPEAVIRILYLRLSLKDRHHLLHLGKKVHNSCERLSLTNKLRSRERIHSDGY
jgi:hypothetical protein